MNHQHIPHFTKYSKKRKKKETKQSLTPYPVIFGSIFPSGTSTSSITICPVTPALSENFPSILGVLRPFILFLEDKTTQCHAVCHVLGPYYEYVCHWGISDPKVIISSINFVTGEPYLVPEELQRITNVYNCVKDKIQLCTEDHFLFLETNTILNHCVWKCCSRLS